MKSHCHDGLPCFKANNNNVIVHVSVSVYSLVVQIRRVTSPILADPGQKTDALIGIQLLLTHNFLQLQYQRQNECG